MEVEFQTVEINGEPMEVLPKSSFEDYTGDLNKQIETLKSTQSVKGLADEEGNFTSEDWTENPNLRKFTNVKGLAKSYENLEKMLGQKNLPQPPKDGTLEDLHKWAVDNGVAPSDPAQYEIEMLEDIPDPLKETFDEKRVESFKAFAHTLGLLPAQVKALAKWEQEQQVNEFQELNKLAEDQDKETREALNEKWGNSYASNLAMAKWAAENIGEATGLDLVNHPAFNDPTMIQALHHISTQLRETSSPRPPAASDMGTLEEQLKGVMDSEDYHSPNMGTQMGRQAHERATQKALQLRQKINSLKGL
jgi:hypothetical protein